MATNWEELAQQFSFGSHAYDYADEGSYKAVINGVRMGAANQNGTYPFDFTFADDNDKQVSFPRARYYLSFKNDNWRKWQNRCLMMALGATKEQAQQAVGNAEDKGTPEAIAKMYSELYTKLASKKPVVAIKVFMNDKYKNTTLVGDAIDNSTSSKNKPTKTEETKVEEMVAQSEEVNLNDIPF